ncbi:MAG: hypothetical protein AAF512_25350 [Pseudomonadota bacterium]
MLLMECRTRSFVVFLVAAAIVITQSFTASSGLFLNRLCNMNVKNTNDYVITHSGKVSGYMSSNGVPRRGFIGCDFNRVLILDNGERVMCAKNVYGYAIDPEIVVISDGRTSEACIAGQRYELR